eukprot:4467811-Prorocentrum_lima.AAC.1
MTSSLVGSEMCIRDRSSPAPCIRVGMCACCSPLGSKTLAEERTSGLMAVSYTHLTLPTICSV